MYKINVITTSRADYGLIRWCIDIINNDPDLELQLVVTGSHLSNEYGYTYKDIVTDGYDITQKVDFLLSSDSSASIVKSIGLCSISFSDIFENLKPDIVLILGDRYELIPISIACQIFNIPIAHISGGDTTEGAIDDNIRDAVSVLSTLHFPGTEESGNRLKHLLKNNNNIYVVGETGIDNYKYLTLKSRKELSRKYNLDISKEWVIATYHPETKIPIEKNLERVENIFNILNTHPDFEVIITFSNADYGGNQINSLWQRITKKSQQFQIIPSLGQLDYLSVLKEVKFVIGNSSSGIVETPFLGVPCINIGNRQKGRHLCKNILSSDGSILSLCECIDIINKNNSFVKDDYYGDGTSSMKIVNIIKNYLYGKIE